MNCQEFEQVILDLARPRLMEAVTRQQGQLHASDCARCAARLDEERQLTRGLQQLAQADQHAHAPARVEANLLAALRERHTQNVRETVPIAPHKSLWARRLALVAAALALAVLLPVGLWRGTAGETPNQSAVLPPSPAMIVWPVPETVSPAIAARPVSGTLATPRPKPARMPRPSATMQMSPPAALPIALPRQPPKSPRVPLSQPQEVVTEFFPLREAATLPATDELHLVRVQLPRSALADFGLPVNEQNGARVTADVLIGADGLARAVRFVR